MRRNLEGRRIECQTASDSDRWELDSENTPCFDKNDIEYQQRLHDDYAQPDDYDD